MHGARHKLRPNACVSLVVSTLIRALRDIWARPSARDRATAKGRRIALPAIAPPAASADLASAGLFAGGRGAVDAWSLTQSSPAGINHVHVEG